MKKLFIFALFIVMTAPFGVQTVAAYGCTDTPYGQVCGNHISSVKIRPTYSRYSNYYQPSQGCGSYCQQDCWSDCYQQPRQQRNNYRQQTTRCYYCGRSSGYTQNYSNSYEYGYDYGVGVSFGVGYQYGYWN